MSKEDKKVDKPAKGPVTQEMKDKVLILLMENGINKADATKLVDMTEKTNKGKDITVENFFNDALDNRPFLPKKLPGGAVVMTPELSKAIDKRNNPARFGDSDAA